MFSGNAMPSLADIAAVTKNDDGTFGGNGAWWIILLVIIFGWGGYGNNGWGNNGSNGSVMDAYVLNSDFATLSRQVDSGFDGLRQQSTSIANGISSLGYDQLSQMNGINTNIANATYDVRNAIQNSDVLSMQNTNTINAGITSLASQLQSCCCQNRYDSATQFAQLNYNLADQSCQTRRTVEDATRDIISNQDANTRSILDFLTQDKIASLTAENTALKSAANNAAQTYDIVSQLKTPQAVPAYVVANPYCNCGCSCSC